MGKYNSYGNYKYKFNIGDSIINNVGTEYKILNFKIVLPRNQIKHQQNGL